MEYEEYVFSGPRILVAGYESQCKNYVNALAASGALPFISLEVNTGHGEAIHQAAPINCDNISLSLASPEHAHRINDFDGLLLPGGGDMNPMLFGQSDAGSRDMDDYLDACQLETLRCFVEAGKPVLGICRGFQVINVFFGGDLIQDIGKLVRVHSGDGCDNVHETTALHDSWLARFYGTRFTTNSRHHQAIGRMGHGLIPIQFAQDHIVEAFVHETLPVMGVQWHPERMSYGLWRPDTVDGAAVFLYFLEMCRRVKNG